MKTTSVYFSPTLPDDSVKGGKVVNVHNQAGELLGQGFCLGRFHGWSGDGDLHEKLQTRGHGLLGDTVSCFKASVIKYVAH